MVPKLLALLHWMGWDKTVNYVPESQIRRQKVEISDAPQLSIETPAETVKSDGPRRRPSKRKKDSEKAATPTEAS